VSLQFTVVVFYSFFSYVALFGTTSSMSADNVNVLLIPAVFCSLFLC